MEALRIVIFFALSVLVLALILKNWNRQQESFSDWDPHDTRKITGNAWKYDNPTARIEYEFKEVAPFTNEEEPISPITWNSYVNSQK